MESEKIMTSVTKEMTFDCAHMLSGYDGPCSNLHGHTYKVQVTIIGYTIAEGSNATMVLDFNDLKQVMDSVVKNKFDHALIVSDARYRGQAEEELLGWTEKWKERYHVFPGRVTAENMAAVIQRDISRKLSTFTNVVGVAVRLWETPTSFAEV